MKAVILAGGLGTRIAEESDTRPKPMIEIGGKPLLWHIMKIYSCHGIKEFVICLGYKGYQIKEYFFNYYKHTSNLEVNLANGDVKILDSACEDWKVTLIDTGLNTMTGGRLLRALSYIGNETFCMTYGDGLANVDISSEIEFHKSHGKPVTVLAVPSPGRFGVMKMEQKYIVNEFIEKPENEMGLINGGFFVLEPSVVDYISGDSVSWETEPLQTLAAEGNVRAFRHNGFWQPCDTLRDKREMEKRWVIDQPWADWKLNEK